METFFNNMTGTDGAKGKLVEDLGVLMRDAESLVKAASGSAADKTKVELQSALDRMKAGCQALEEKARSGVRRADEVIREHPYQSLGAAFAVGVLIGALAGRGRGD